MKYLYCLLFVFSAVTEISKGVEVKVNHDYRYNFNSFIAALNAHVPKNKIIFARFGVDKTLIICEDLEKEKLFLFCPVSAGVVKIHNENLKPYDKESIIHTFSLVPGALYRGDGQVENNFDISVKELSGYWLNKTNDIYLVKIVWQPMSSTIEKIGGLAEDTIKIYKSKTGLWVAQEI